MITINFRTESNNLKAKIRAIIDEVLLYWNTPRPGEYVCYRELACLSIGWMAMYFCTMFAINFGVGNGFTGATLEMTNDELLVMSYVCQIIGYILTPINSWLTDNLKSPHGKYRVYIRFAIPLMFLSLLALWLPYEAMRDGVSRYFMIAVLFIIGQIQGYVMGWFQTGITCMVYVITPNTQERSKIMSITGVIYSFAPTILNVYVPLMADILPVNGNIYTMTYYRGTYTPLMLFAPLALLAFYGTKERLVLPQSRETNLSFVNSIKSVAGNRIFWIKCFDAWNNFLEGAKGNVWEMLVYRAHITSSTVYGIMNTFCHNAQLWSMIFSPALIKKFGKKKLKVTKNIMQVFLIAGIGLCYKSRFAIVFLFIINYINRFIDCAEVIDKAIESDMRDTQQYLVGERIDGSFGFISSYANGAVSMVTNLFLPWVYKKCGFDGKDYSVLDVYLDYNPDLPLSQQKKNPNCVLYSMLDVLIKISVLGAALDVLPWFLYDVTETGQKSMIRVIRIRTLVEDFNSDKRDDMNYLEGCDAIFESRIYKDREKADVSKNKIKTARSLSKNSDGEKIIRKAEIKEAKTQRNANLDFNEEIEVAKFVDFELNRFNTEFGKKQIELAYLIKNAGPDAFALICNDAVDFASKLPRSTVKEEKIWRRQEITNANSLKKSARLAEKYYSDGHVFFDNQTLEDAFDMPDTTKQESRLRRKAIKEATKQKNRYIRVAAPYLSAVRTVKLYEGYKNIDEIVAEYDNVKKQVNDEKRQQEESAKRLLEERRLDAENRKAQKRIKSAK